MNFNAALIAKYLNGEVEGDSGATVNDVSKIEEGRPGTLSFLANPKYEKYLYQTEATLVIVNQDFKAQKPIPEGTTLIRVKNAYESFATLLRLYEESKPRQSGISAQAAVAESAKLGRDLYIGEFTVVSAQASIGDGVQLYPQVYVGEDVRIGEGSIIHPGVKIYTGCEIGAHCTIHAGAIIGADGFGFAPNQENNYEKVPQLGKVIIEDHVDVGANTTIDRATMGATIIRKGVKLDNLIMIAHNVEVGENTVIAAQSGISGSSSVGKNCMFGGQVGLAGHIHIADGIKIAAQSGITKDFKKEGTVLLGSPAFDAGLFARSFAVFRNLPQLKEQVQDLEQRIKELEQ